MDMNEDDDEVTSGEWGGCSNGWMDL